jgi:hypothetical protein
MKTMRCFLVFLAILVPYQGWRVLVVVAHPSSGISTFGYAENGVTLLTQGCVSGDRAPLPMQQAAKHVRYRAAFSVATCDSGFFVESLRCRVRQPDHFFSEPIYGIINPPV